jgi:TRAP-type C4-dicarboxylate transport system permease small subunit
MSALLRNLSVRLNRWCLRLAAVLTLAILALIGIQVVARYGFSRPPQWTEEAARFCMVWAGLLGATVSFYQGSDPVMMSLPFKPGGKSSHFLLWSRGVAIALFIGPILYYSPGFLMRNMLRVSDSLHLNMAMVMAIVPLTAIIVGIHLAARLSNLNKP